MMPKIEIVIADDHKLFIEGLEVLLGQLEDFLIVGIANDGKQLLDLLEKLKTNIILLDINMPKLNGMEVLKFLHSYRPDIKIIILSTYHARHLVENARDLGAQGYLLKNSNKEMLIAAIRSVSQGNKSFPLLDDQLSISADEFDDFLRQFNLTKRELELLRLIKEEYTNLEMANKLFLSIYTIETHRKNIMLKLGINNPGALMKFIVTHNI